MIKVTGQAPRLLFDPLLIRISDLRQVEAKAILQGWTGPDGSWRHLREFERAPVRNWLGSLPVRPFDRPVKSITILSCNIGSFNIGSYQLLHRRIYFNYYVDGIFDLEYFTSMYQVHEQVPRQDFDPLL